ncbi:hypothetical protein DPMN_001313 [Dreissena polymorpha]|uniref:Uncharacterized protein n=1 Tax=Dreissena polymorpha TaxID=45954 RepID=A0A9D4MJM2_DREPO|nr:hypothetical protein DPMN_001313 [Dreissena polymorpha]
MVRLTQLLFARDYIRFTRVQDRTRRQLTAWCVQSRRDCCAISFGAGFREVLLDFSRCIERPSRLLRFNRGRLTFQRPE